MDSLVGVLSNGNERPRTFARCPDFKDLLQEHPKRVVSFSDLFSTAAD
jgi:hypothetical protein